LTALRTPRITSTGPGPAPLGTSASAATMKIIAAISGTPNTTVKNATACPGWAACSDLPSR
jgi:hypothetical protein